jgi:hypothetical protein
MTKTEFNVPLESCIISNSSFIKSDEILLNEFTKRKINIHNKKLSPVNSNTFLINTNITNNNNQIDFYSICYDNKIKLCSITHHIVKFE